MVEMGKASGMHDITEDKVAGARESFGAPMLAGSEQGKYLECDTELVTFDATKYGGVNSGLEMYVHKVKGKEDKNRPALIFFYGGAFFFFGAKHFRAHTCDHAVNFDCTVFSVEYGNAPETKAPDTKMNGYAALKYVLENAARFNIDPNRVAIGGESSGGHLTGCLSMELARRNESHLVKFAWMDIPAVSNHWFSRTDENSSYTEKPNAKGHINCMRLYAKDLDN